MGGCRLPPGPGPAVLPYARRDRRRRPPRRTADRLLHRRKIKVVAGYHAGPGAVEKYGGVPALRDHPPVRRDGACGATSSTERSRATAPSNSGERAERARRLLLAISDQARMESSMTAISLRRRARRGEGISGEAEGGILRALTDAPKNVQALNLLALVRYTLGRLQEAHATYREWRGRRRRTHTRAATWVSSRSSWGRSRRRCRSWRWRCAFAGRRARLELPRLRLREKKGEVVEAAAAFRRAGQDALALEL